MKRADITELFPDASKEAIEKLMGINGADVNAVKAENESLKQQLAEAMKFQNAGAELQKVQQELDGMKKAEAVRLTREKVAGEKNIPVHLLTGETEEACVKQADDILAYAKPKGYQPFRDGGEVQTKPGSVSTRDQFADYFNKIIS